jgi:hypothetical protein
VLALALAAPIAACGGDEGGPGAPRPAGPVPPADRTPTAEERPAEPSGGGEAAPDRADGGGSASGGDRGGAGSDGGGEGSYDPSRPDEPGNDKPPPAGSAAERFERYCEQNPGACD